MRFSNTIAKLAVAGAAMLALGGAAPAGARAADCAYADDVPTRTSGTGTFANYYNYMIARRASDAVICLTNNERAARGLGALTRNSKLTTAAIKHSWDMADRNYFSHYSPEGTGPLQRIQAAGYCSSCWWGENISWGTGSYSTPRSVVSRWMASTGHRANILNPNFRDVGVWAATAAPTAYTGQAATYTQVFGG
jgi:uncharacterized protein YkwD